MTRRQLLGSLVGLLGGSLAVLAGAWPAHGRLPLPPRRSRGGWSCYTYDARGRQVSSTDWVPEEMVSHYSANGDFLCERLSQPRL